MFIPQNQIQLISNIETNCVPKAHSELVLEHRMQFLISTNFIVQRSKAVQINSRPTCQKSRSTQRLHLLLIANKSPLLGLQQPSGLPYPFQWEQSRSVIRTALQPRRKQENSLPIINLCFFLWQSYLGIGESLSFHNEIK